MNKPAANLGQGPDRAAALEQYRLRAGTYDMELALFEPLRCEAVRRLALRPGEVVLDVGCGTGLSLEMLHAGVGASGRTIGIEQSAPMLDRARERVAQHQWSGISLVCAPAEDARFPGHADAALFHFTHDILRRPEAVRNIVHHLKPGARVVACGLQWAPAWAVPTNLLVMMAALYSVTSLEGLNQPWSGLAGFTGPLDVESLWAGGAYVASGTVTGKH